MNSLSQKCQEYKEKYDNCFNNWFSEHFLKGNFENKCEEEFRIYQKCVKEAINEQKIELWHIEHEPTDKQHQHQPKKTK